jgi:hypothetical protein
MTGRRKPDANVVRNHRSKANLGQQDAELQKLSQEELRHMADRNVTEAARQKAKYSSTAGVGRPGT